MGHAQRQLFEMVEELPEVELAKIIDFAQSIKKKQIEKPRRSRAEMLGCLAGQSWIADDFFEPLDEFKEYVD